MSRLPSLIRQETREMIAENDLVNSPDDINGGFCQPLARDVASRVPGAKVYEGWHGMGSRHFFIKYNGKYYDSERPNGVSNPSQLPFFQGKPPSGMERADSRDKEFM